ncbi:hypothetical protein MKW98_007312 [Papaver atlanticum]|uniref:Uncharacterized protein n=1 Tax=Papaver atlanticum TaxID=357466 RepID=A0AAD4SAZ8_9MAGN|nr:hypothetical protein MKW98_007312 [Papaver atlanticum]
MPTGSVLAPKFSSQFPTFNSSSYVSIFNTEKQQILNGNFRQFDYGGSNGNPNLNTDLRQGDEGSLSVSAGETLHNLRENTKEMQRLGVIFPGGLSAVCFADKIHFFFYMGFPLWLSFSMGIELQPDNELSTVFVPYHWKMPLSTHFYFLYADFEN